MTIKYPAGGHVHVDPSKVPGDGGKEAFWPFSNKKSVEDDGIKLTLRDHPLIRKGEELAHLVIHGEPVPAGRPRFNHNGHAYDPRRSRDYKRFVSQEAKMKYHGGLLRDMPLKVEIRVYRHVQRSLSKVERDRRLRGEHRPIVKPDTSNYVKLIEDALTGIVWEDDNLITDLVASKWYSDDPRIEVTVTEAGK